MAMYSNRSVNMLWKVLFYPALLVLLVRCQDSVTARSDMAIPPEVSEHSGPMYATCKMRPSATLPEDLPRVNGHVIFKQEYPDATLQVLVRLRGFPNEESELKAVHIHQYGDLSQGCESTGGHYNPHNVPHPSHPGDFGNFATQAGRINKMIESQATLFGEMSVIGRAVVVHEKMDDLGRGGDAGSLLHGNAGRRLGCCVIGISSPELWNMFLNRQQRRV